VKIFSWLLLWVGLVLAIGIISGRQCWKYYRLSGHGVRAQGIAGERRPHAQIAYSLTLNRQVYQGVGFADDDKILPGAPVSVVYLPEDPAKNCLGNPHDLYQSELLPVAAVSLLFPTFILIRVAYVLKRRSRAEEKERTFS
jgi:hypothetical protein